jgi:NAD(P)-dependent dehydrogenase (short-subunit alcohol dehydrogenase family)
MNDQVALLTGASGDIGQAISKELLRAGASVLLLDRRTDPAAVRAPEAQAVQRHVTEETRIPGTEPTLVTSECAACRGENLRAGWRLFSRATNGVGHADNDRRPYNARCWL